VTLIITEAELIAMSEWPRTTMSLLSLIEYIVEQGKGRFDSCTKVHCKVFEDKNAGAFTMATLSKVRPRTNYINGKYWLLREHSDHGKRSIHAGFHQG